MNRRDFEQSWFDRMDKRFADILSKCDDVGVMAAMDGDKRALGDVSSVHDCAKCGVPILGVADVCMSCAIHTTGSV